MVVAFKQINYFGAPCWVRIFRTHKVGWVGLAGPQKSPSDQIGTKFALRVLLFLRSDVCHRPFFAWGEGMKGKHHAKSHALPFEKLLPRVNSMLKREGGSAFFRQV